jgi:hypothetical protein
VFHVLSCKGAADALQKVMEFFGQAFTYSDEKDEDWFEQLITRRGQCH